MACERLWFVLWNCIVMDHLNDTTEVPSTIMWVDDDADLLWLMSRTLGRKGFDVRTTDHAPTCEQVLEAHPVVVFLDVDLGEENGVDVCRLIKRDERSASIPVVLVSAQPRERLKKSAASCGADGFITKPFDPGRIVHLAERYANQEHAA